MKLVFPSELDLPAEVTAEYRLLGQLPDGRICGVRRLIFHCSLCIDINETGYEDKYCYGNEWDARVAMVEWNGEGDPKGWHRHLKTGRRRNIVTGREWVQH